MERFFDENFRGLVRSKFSNNSIHLLLVLAFQAITFSVYSQQSGCDFEVGEPIILNTENIVLEPDSDSLLYILSDNDDQIIETNNTPTFQSPNNPGEYHVIALQFKISETTVTGLSVGSSLNTVDVSGCFDWSTPFDISICQCSTPLTTLDTLICVGSNIQFGNQSIESPGIYLDTINLLNGCDSVIRLNLSVINNQDTLRHYQSICDGESVEFGGAFYSTAGTYFDTEIIDGCIKIKVLELTLNQGETPILGTSFYPCFISEGESPQLQIATPSQNADSTVYIAVTEAGDILEIQDNLNFNNFQIGKYLIYSLSFSHDTQIIGLLPDQNITDIEICGCADISEPFGFEVCQGCENDYLEIDDLICTGGSYQFGNQVLTMSGMYFDTVSLSNNCKKITRLNLTEVDTDSVFVFGNICGSDSFFYSDTYFTEVGTYHLSRVTGNCEKITTIQITKSDKLFIPVTTSFENCAFYEDETIDLSQSSLPQNTDSTLYILTTDSGLITELNSIPAFNTNAKGKYMAYAISFSGSSSIENLEVGKNIQNIIACDGVDISDPYGFEICEECSDKFFALSKGICFDDVYEFAGMSLNAQGVYYDTVNLDSECRSIFQLTLFHFNQDTIRLSESICQGDSIFFNGQYIFEEGTYYQNETQNGCIQISSLKLEVDLGISPVIPASSDSCTHSVGDMIELSSIPHSMEGDILIYILTTNDGTIIFLSEDSNVPINNPGYYHGYLLSYDSNSETSGLELGENIKNIMICGIGEISSPDSFQVCDECVDQFFAKEVRMCFGDSYDFGGQLLEEEGTYFDTVILADQCIAVTKLDLFHYNQDTIAYFATLCEGSDSVFFYGQFYTTKGDYFHVENDEINGCHQVYALHLDIIDHKEIQLGVDYLSCAFLLGEGISFTAIDNNNAVSAFNQFALVDEEGIILELKSILEFDLDSAGLFQVIPISSDSDASFFGLEKGENIQEAFMCGCVDVGDAFGFEICDLSCDTSFVNLTESICFTEFYEFGDRDLNSSGEYIDTLSTDSGCDSIVTLNLDVTGEYAISALPTEYDSCFADTETPFTLAFEIGELLCDDLITYVLVDEIGVIINIKNIPNYSGLAPGKYSVYPFNYLADSIPSELAVWSNILEVGTCSCLKVFEPKNFEICSPCPNVDIDRPNVYEQCGYVAGRDYSLQVSGGSTSNDEVIKYIITDNSGQIITIENNPNFNLNDAGFYEMYALSYTSESKIFGLDSGFNISDIVICGCYDMSQGFGFEVCEFQYDLALKFYLDHQKSYNLYHDIPASIKVINQGTAAVSGFGLVTYLPEGLTLSNNDSNWTLTSDSLAQFSFDNILEAGDSIVISVLLTSSSVAYDRYIQSVVGSAEITFMRDLESILVSDEDSYPDPIRKNDNGSFPQTDNWIDGVGIIDEDDHDFIGINFEYAVHSGWIYSESTGQIITDGQINITEPSNIIVLKDGTTGEYEYIADSTGHYLLTFSHPKGYPLDAECNVSQDILYISENEGNPVYDSDGLINDTLTLGSDAQSGFLSDVSCSANPYHEHLYYDAQNPKTLVNNNIPLLRMGNITIKCDGSGDNPNVNGLSGVKVELYTCEDTLRPIDSTFTYGDGGFEFSNIEAIGCYKIKVYESKDINVDANDDISSDGWSRDIAVDWGSSDSILFACFENCDLTPLHIGEPTALDSCLFEIGTPINLREQFVNTGQKDTTLYILTDTIGEILEINNTPQFNDPGIGQFLGLALDINRLRNLQGLEVGNLIQNVQSCLRDSALVYGPFEVSVCSFFDLALKKVISKDFKGSIKPFSHVPFTITVYNQGRIGARKIEVIEHFPKGMVLSDQDTMWTLENDSTAMYTIKDQLDPGDSIEIEIMTYITPYVIRHGIENLVNIAEVAGALDSLNRPVQDLDSTADTIVDNDKGGNKGDGTDDEINDNGTMDEDDSDPAVITLDPLDPQGFIYCSKTGEIIKGGIVSVTGPGNIDLTMDGSDGSYQFFVDAPGEYDISYSHPDGFPIDTDCPEFSGVYDPTGKDGDPAFDKDGEVNQVLTIGADTLDGILSDVSCTANPYFLRIQIDPNDPPLITRNNIPISCIIIASSICVTTDLTENINGDESGIENVEVALYMCNDTINPVQSTYTDTSGNYSFSNLEEPGCYKLKFSETESLQVIPSDVVDNNGWSQNVNVDWGDCDSTISICYTLCDLDAPIPVMTPVFGCFNDELPILNVSVPLGHTADWYDASQGGNLLASDTTSYRPSNEGIFYAEMKYVGPNNTCRSSTRSSLSVIKHQPLSCIAIPTAASCNESYGSVDLIVKGDNENRKAFWYMEGSLDTVFMSDISDTTKLENLSAGLWHFQVSDGNDCYSTCTALIEAPAPLSCDISERNDVSCYGEKDGSIMALAIGGTAPYTFTLNGITQNSAVFENLPSGSYSLVVEDNNFCTNLSVFSIHEPDTLRCFVTIDSQPKCASSQGGSVSISSHGGTGAKSYFLGDEMNLTGSFSGLDAGSYSALVIDENGCESTCSFILRNSDLDLSCSVEITSPLSCNGSNDAEIRVTASSQSSDTLRFELDGISNSTGIFTGLSQGEHFITVIDEDSCSSSCSILITATYDISCSIEALDLPLCEEISNGRVRVMVSESGNFAYSLNNSPFQASNEFDGLQPGNYQASVMNENGCISSCMITLSQPDDMFCIIGSVNNITCTGGADGSFKVRALQGMPPFLYSINGGAYISDSIFENLESGSYNVSVRDSHGCESSCAVTLMSNEDISCNISTVEHSSCHEGILIKVQASGGMPPYNYSLNGGALTSDTLIQITQAGTHLIQIYDANGCMKECTHMVEESGVLECETIFVQNDSCGSDSKGIFEIQASGGAAPYTYIYGDIEQDNGRFTNISAGIHSIMVTDQNSCTSICTVELGFDDQNSLFLNCETDIIDLGCNPGSIPNINQLVNDGLIEADGFNLIAIEERKDTINCKYFSTIRYTAETSCGTAVNDTCELRLKWTIDNNIPPLPQIDTILYVECDRLRGDPITIIDNCGYPITAEPVDLMQGGSCPNQYSLLRKWTFIDSCGNQSEILQTIHVEDNEEPTLIGVPDDLEVANEADIPAIANVTAMDNCGASQVIFSEERSDEGCTYTLSRSWTAIDGCGNEVTSNQLIKVTLCDSISVIDTIDIELSKKVSDATPYIGDRIEYSLLIKNRGPDRASGIGVTDFLPNGISDIKDLSHNGVVDNKDILWNDLIVNAGDSLILTYTGIVQEPLSGMSYMNIAEITAADQYDIDSDSANDDGDQSEDDEDSVDIDPQGKEGSGHFVDLELVKTVSDTSAGIRDIVTYTITVRNNGDTVATGIGVSDYLPIVYCNNFENISHDGTRINDEIRWSEISLQPGEEIELTFNATISGKANNQLIYNVAEITGQDQNDIDSSPDNDMITEDDQDEAVIRVGKISDLSLNKKIINPDAGVNDTVSFEITVYNAGPDLLSFGEVEDVIPDGYSNIHNISHGGFLFTDRLAWYILDLPVNDSITFSFHAKIAHFENQECDYVNRAEIRRSTNGDPDSTPGNGDKGLNEDDEDTAAPYFATESEDQIDSTCVSLELAVLLEGPYQYAEGKMSVELNELGYLPGQDPVTFFGNSTAAGQPYGIAPWEYYGTEGWSYDFQLEDISLQTEYPEETTDYVYISLRTEETFESTVYKKAALLMEDGTVESLELNCFNLPNHEGGYYLVVEHRNHLPVMSHEKIFIKDKTITYDFRKQDSYIKALGYGQKQVDHDRWAMFAGNGDQTLSSNSPKDLNVKDLGSWLLDDGKNSSYYLRDLDLSGDVNVQDKGLILRNNGIFTDVKVNR